MLPESPVWAAIFHAVSAFCNAGFSTFPKGMEPFVTSVLPCQTIAALVVLGGLGFLIVGGLGRVDADVRAVIGEVTEDVGLFRVAPGRKPPVPQQTQHPPVAPAAPLPSASVDAAASAGELDLQVTHER